MENHEAVSKIKLNISKSVLAPALVKLQAGSREHLCPPSCGLSEDQPQPCHLCWLGSSSCRMKNWSEVAASASDFQGTGRRDQERVETESQGVRWL